METPLSAMQQLSRPYVDVTLSVDSWSSELACARAQVTALWAGLSRIDLSPYEEGRQDGIVKLRDLTIHALLELATFAGDLMSRCDKTISQGVPSDTEQPLRLLSDTCFMAAAEAEIRKAEVERTTRTTAPLHGFFACGSALRRARKALGSIDHDLARVLGVAPGIDSGTRLAESLEIRKHYSLVRRSAEGSGPPASSDVGQRLRTVALRISLLREREIYPQLRLEDRLEFHILQQRIEAWQTDGADALQGMRLWQDAVGFGRLLHQVNLRQELRAHDVALADFALARLEAEGEAGLDDTLWNALKGLMGLHDGLDDLLRRNDRCLPQCVDILRTLGGPLTTLEAARGQDMPETNGE